MSSPYSHQPLDDEADWLGSKRKTGSRLVRTRSLPSLALFDGDLTDGAADWITDRYELEERRKLDIIARYDPEGTTLESIRARYESQRNRTWRSAKLRVVHEHREARLDAEPVAEIPTGIFDPSRPMFRWTLLFFCCFITCSSWSQYDAIGALGEQFRNHTDAALHLSEADLGILDAIYSFPNCVLPLFGGILIDRLGMRFSLLLFCGLVCLGSGILAAGVNLDLWWMVVVSRVVFGFGGESLYVAQDSFTSYWFEGRDLAFALALTTVVGRGADIATFAGFPLAADKIGVGGTMYVLVGICGMSMVATLICVWMDRAAERYSLKVDDEEAVREDYSVKGILTFGAEFWLAAILTAVFYACVLPFMNLAPKFLIDVYNIPRDQAGWYVSIISVVAIVLSPVLGLILDRVGYRIYLIQVGLVSLILAYALLLMPQHVQSPIPSLVLLGVSFSVVPAAVWPCIAILIPARFFGTAYGIMEALLNTADAGLFYGLGYLFSDNGDHFAPLFMFMWLSCLGWLVSMVWLTLDLRHGNRCNLPTEVVVKPNKDEIPLITDHSNLDSEKTLLINALAFGDDD